MRRSSIFRSLLICCDDENGKGSSRLGKEAVAGIWKLGDDACDELLEHGLSDEGWSLGVFVVAIEREEEGGSKGA